MAFGLIGLARSCYGNKKKKKEEKDETKIDVFFFFFVGSPTTAWEGKDVMQQVRRMRKRNTGDHRPILFISFCGISGFDSLGFFFFLEIDEKVCVTKVKSKKNKQKKVMSLKKKKNEKIRLLLEEVRTPQHQRHERIIRLRRRSEGGTTSRTGEKKNAQYKLKEVKRKV